MVWPTALAWAKLSEVETQLAERRQALVDADRDREWLDFSIERDRQARGRGWRGREARRCADADEGGGAGRGRSGRARPAFYRFRRRAVAASPGGASAGADPRCSPAARRSAGRDRPRDHRSCRGRGKDRAGAARAGAFAGRSGRGRGPLVRHSRRWPASTASSPTSLPACSTICARGARRSTMARKRLSRSNGRLRWPGTNIAGAAKALTDARRAAAVRLDAAVAGELAPLKLDAARFRTAMATARGRAGGRSTGSNSRCRPTPVRHSGR